MFAVVTKQLVFVLSLALWLTTAAQAESSDTRLDLSELTKATLALKRDLLSAEERLFQQNPNTLTIFINTDNLPARLLNELEISVDNRAVVQHMFTAQEAQTLNSGAMKKIYAAPITTGTHTVTIVINGSTTNRERSATTFTMAKGAGHDTLKVTIANPLQKRTPDLFFEQQAGVAP